MNLTSLLLPDDHEAVNVLMESYLRSWNKQDIDALLVLFSEHAEFTGITADIATGKPAIRQLLDYYFGVGQETRFGFSELYLRYLQPKMVMGTAHWNLQTETGRNGILHFICLKTPEKGWKIILLHSLELSNQPATALEEK